MSTPPTIGPLLACAISDAYGAGFEFASAAYVKKHNRMTEYIPHPKFAGRPANHYTDDTQMALGLVEHLLSGKPTTAMALADCWVEGFKRDPRQGYSKGFYDILTTVTSGAELLSKVTPHSTKNGGAMRAFACGVFPTPAMVMDMAMMQASITHATWRGMMAAAASALMFHYFYHRIGRKADLVQALQNWLPGTDWSLQALKQTTGNVSPEKGTDGLNTVRAAVHCVVQGNSLADVIQMAVSLGEDTDTGAAIVAASAAVSEEIRNALPDTLVAGLENGTYGRDYLIAMDNQLLHRFPSRWQIPPSFPVTKSKPKPATAPKPKPVESEPEEGPLDFLFKD